MQYFQTFETKPTISLEQVLWVFHYYWYKGEINFWNFGFEDGMEFKWKHNLDYFETLLQLHLESAITLKLSWKIINEFGRRNKDLEKAIKSYQDKGIFWKKSYDLLSLRMNWDIEKEKIKPYDGIWYSVQVNGYRFLELLFCKISHEKWYLDIDRKTVGQNFYSYILDSTGWKNNYNDKIILKYKFDDYLESRRIVLPLLAELEELWRLKISQISLKDNYISFTLSNILDLSQEIVDETIQKIPGRFFMEWEPREIEKVEYTKEGVKINDVLWKPENSKKTEAFLHLLSLYFEENKNINYIHLKTLCDFYEKNKDKLVDTLVLNEKNIKNWYFRTFNTKLSEDYIGNFLQMSRWLIEAKTTFEDTTS